MPHLWQAKVPKAQPEKTTATLLPKVIMYDDTGKPLKSQDTRVELKKEAAVADVLWKEWLNCAVGQELDAVAADEAAVAQVLRSLHLDAVLQ